MLALMDFPVTKCQCALLCLPRAIEEHLETSKGWTPNSKDMPAVGTGDGRGGGKLIPAYHQHRCSSSGVETLSAFVRHYRWDCSGYINWPEQAHHHLASFAAAGTCLWETGLREQVLGLVKPLLGLGILLCSDTDGTGCWWVINVKKDQISSW